MAVPYGWAPAEYLQRQYLGQSVAPAVIDPDLAYNPQTYGSEQMTPEQMTAWQQQFWIPQIATGGYIPPEFDNPEAMAALGQTDAYNQRMQYLSAQGAQRVATLQDRQAEQRRGGPAALGYAAIGALGGTLGGLAGAGAGGAATTYPLASGGPITATPIATGAGSATVSGATTATGVAGAGAAGGTVPNWVNWANLGSTVLGLYGADRAADAQVAGSDAAIAESRRQYDTTRGDFQPSIKLLGESADALSRYNSGDTSGFFTSPEYTYNLEQTTKAGERALASMGLRQSGTAVKEAQRNASGLSSGESSAFVNRLLASAGLGTTGASNVASAGANTAAQVGDASMNRGAARASGYANQFGALQGGIKNYLLSKYLRT